MTFQRRLHKEIWQIHEGKIIFCWLFYSWYAFVFSAAASAQSNKVIIGYANFSPTYAPVWVAKEMGFFDKYNVNAEIIFIRGGAMGTQALVSRSFDFIIAGGVAAIEAALAGADLVIVAVPSNRMDQVFVARKEITHPAQLKGKKIAVNSLVGSAILAIKIMLQALGINPEKEVTYVTSGDPATRARSAPVRPCRCHRIVSALHPDREARGL